MKIALVNPPPWAVNSPPIGFGYLISYLRQKNHMVFPFDFNIETYAKSDSNKKYLWTRDLDSYWIKDHNSFINHEIDIWVSKVLNTKAPIIGVTLCNDSKGISLEFARKIKKKDPEKIIIMGGPECYSGFLRDNIINNRNIDCIIVGEAEETLCEFLDSYQEKGHLTPIQGTITKINNKPVYWKKRQNICNLDILPYPDFSDLPRKLYARQNEISILTSRGCMAGCAFCQDCLNSGIYRSRSANNIFDEMLVRYESGYTNFFFNDLVSNGDIRQLNLLCDLIIKSPMVQKISISSQMRCSPQMSPGLYKKLKQAGWVTILYGVESASQKILDKMHKGYKVGDVKKNIRCTAAVDIRAEINLIVGFPGETEETFNETLQFIKENHRYIHTLAALYDLDLRIGSDIALNYKKYGIKALSKEGYWITTDKKNSYQWRLSLIKRVIDLANSLHIRLGFDDTHFYYYHALTYYHQYLKDYPESYKIMMEALQYLSSKIQYLKKELVKFE